MKAHFLYVITKIQLNVYSFDMDGSVDNGIGINNIWDVIWSTLVHFVMQIFFLLKSVIISFIHFDLGKHCFF